MHSRVRRGSLCVEAPFVSEGRERRDPLVSAWGTWRDRNRKNRGNTPSYGLVERREEGRTRVGSSWIPFFSTSRVGSRTPGRPGGLTSRGRWITVRTPGVDLVGDLVPMARQSVHVHLLQVLR